MLKTGGEQAKVLYLNDRHQSWSEATHPLTGIIMHVSCCLQSSYSVFHLKLLHIEFHRQNCPHEMVSVYVVDLCTFHFLALFFNQKVQRLYKKILRIKSMEKDFISNWTFYNICGKKMAG